MAAGRRARTDGRNGCRTPTDLHVCDWGRVRGSDTIHRGVMKQRLFAIHSRSRATRKGVWPCGIGRPITSDAHKPGSWFPELALSDRGEVGGELHWAPCADGRCI